MTAETENEAHVRALIAAWNRDDWEALERGYSPDAEARRAFEAGELSDA